MRSAAGVAATPAAPMPVRAVHLTGSARSPCASSRVARCSGAAASIRASRSSSLGIGAPQAARTCSPSHGRWRHTLSRFASRGASSRVRSPAGRGRTAAVRRPPPPRRLPNGERPSGCLRQRDQAVAGVGEGLRRGLPLRFVAPASLGAFALSSRIRACSISPPIFAFLAANCAIRSTTAGESPTLWLSATCPTFRRKSGGPDLTRQLPCELLADSRNPLTVRDLRCS